MSRSSASKGIVLAAAACLLVVGSRASARTDHRPYKDAKQDDCKACHQSEGVAETHGAFFDKNHRVAAERSSNNCNDCHQQSYCLDCHNGGNVDASQKTLSRRGESKPLSHRTDFISTHPLKAADDPQSCHRCHAPDACSDCHTKTQQNGINARKQAMSIKPHKPTFVSNGVPDPSWVSFHRGEARRNLASCQGCHPQKSDCSNFACHPNLRGR